MWYVNEDGEEGESGQREVVEHGDKAEDLGPRLHLIPAPPKMRHAILLAHR